MTENGPDIRELRYFLACVETGSFSEAARILYTTQGNVSKVISTMEKELGTALFVRSRRGISLTDQGRYVYEHAGKVIDELEMLRNFSDARQEGWLKLSCNPSSRLADLIVDFYQLHRDRDLHLRVISTGIREVVTRVADHKDEIGFVHVPGSSLPSFRRSLVRRDLEMTAFREIDMVLYRGLGGSCLEGREPEKKGGQGGPRLIQSYYDEIPEEVMNTVREMLGEESEVPETAIITNSDYVTQRILNKTDLINVSGASILNHGGVEDMNGTGTRIPEQKIIFGSIQRKGEVLTAWAQEFLAFVRDNTTFVG